MDIGKRLADSWAVLTGKPSSSEMALQQEVVSLKRRLGEIALELQDAVDKVAAQRSALEDRDPEASNQGNDRLADLLARLAAPLSQLRMQASLMDAGKEISGRSVMALAGQIVELVEIAGLDPIGVNGDTIAFDPRTCEPLVSGTSFTPGTEVTVRIIGYAYRGEVIRKALVDGGT